MQRRHRPDEGRDVDDQVHVVGLDQHGSDQLVHVEVREQVEDVLHVVHDLPRDSGKRARTVKTERITYLHIKRSIARHQTELPLISVACRMPVIVHDGCRLPCATWDGLEKTMKFLQVSEMMLFLLLFIS